MSIDRKKKKVVSQLTEDKARNDASYAYSKNSIEPVAEGALKGALGSSIASRVLRESDTARKVLPKNKTETAIVGAGTIIGAISGKMYNDKKVEQAKKARKWLSDKRRSNDYIKKTKDIYKQSSSIDGIQLTPEQARELAIKQMEEKRREQEQRRGVGDIVKETAAFGGGGAVVGGVMGSLKDVALQKKLNFLRFAKNWKANALLGGSKMGAIMGATTLIPSLIDSGVKKAEDEAGVDIEKKNPTAAMVASGAIMGGASGFVEPTVNKFVGRHIVPRVDKDGNVVKDLNKTIKERTKAPGFIMKHVPEKARPYIPFGGAGAVADEKEILSGVGTKGKPFFKGLLKPSLQKATRYGVGGAIASYGIAKLLEHLQKKNQQNNQFQKTASFSASELISIKEDDARKKVSASRMASLGRKGGLAALGYAIGSKIGGKKTGEMLAKATLIYSVPKLIKEELDRHDANSFLSMSRPEKLSVVRKIDLDTKPGAKTLLHAYAGKRIFDQIIGPEKVENVNSKSSAKNKFNIRDAM